MFKADRIILNALLVGLIFVPTIIESCSGRVPLPPKPSDAPPAPPASPSAEPKPPSNTDPQPTNPTEFFNLMKKAGFKQTAQVITAEIKREAALPITKWSTAVKMEDKFKDAQKFLKPVATDIKDYSARSLKLAAKKDGVDLFIDVTFGAKDGTINLAKVDTKTNEILPFDKNGLIINYTQDPALLSTIKYMMVPKAVFSSTIESNSSSRW